MGQIQNEDIKSAAELVTAGATAASLPNDTKIYVTANGINDTLANAITNNLIGSSSGSSYNVVSKTSNYSAAINDYIICSSSSFTVTLPTAAGQAGKSISIQHNGTNFSQVYTLNTTSAQTIGGIASGSYALYTNSELLTVVSDGSNWLIAVHRTQTAWADAGVSNPTTTNGYVFTITSSSVTAGAVYSNNSQNFYVTLTIASSTTLTCSGTGAPTSSGTLTKVSGTGPSTITFSAVTNNNPTKGTATMVADHNWWRRNGQNLELRIELAMSAAGTATGGTGDYLWWIQGSYNANIQIDTTVLTANQTAAWLSGEPTAMSGVVGNGAFRVTTNSGSGVLGVSVYDSTKLRMSTIDMAANFSSGNACGIGSGHGSFNQTPSISVLCYIPIQGWQP